MKTEKEISEERTATLEAETAARQTRMGSNRRASKEVGLGAKPRLRPAEINQRTSCT